MKRMKHILAAAIATAVVLAGCGGKDAGWENNPQDLLGLPREEVHRLLGEPTGELSGFWGEIFLDGDTELIVYYGADGNVDAVKVGDGPTVGIIGQAE